MQKSFFLFYLFTFTLAFSSSIRSEVKAPNYNFSLDTLKDFYPGKKLSDIKKKYPKIEPMKKDGSVYRAYVAHIRYRFPVFIYIYQETVMSFFARLPTYFLHDLFHQSMINRYGKQDRYKKVNGSALYIWNNENGIKFTYKGECTITCFPSYLSGDLISKPQGAPTQTLLKELSIF
jgi:hypothetical protein